MGDAEVQIELSDSHKIKLLDLAHAALAAYIPHRRLPKTEIKEPALNRLAGVFVTLRKQRQLRGCIGHVAADQPLYQLIQEMAVAAATQDPRFSPVIQDELPEITIEISVLSPFFKLPGVEAVEVGKHGLLLEYQGHRGLLLPKVPLDRGALNDTSAAPPCPNTWSGTKAK